MAHPLTEEEAAQLGAASNGQPSYPWNEWLDGSRWRLAQGEAFPGIMDAFRGTLRRAVGKHRVALQVWRVGEQFVIEATSLDKLAERYPDVVEEYNRQRAAEEGS